MKPRLLQGQVPLAPLTTFEVGGPARWLARATNTGELQELLHWAHTEGLPVLVLGGGSNVLIADAGYPGLVIQLHFTDIELLGPGRARVGAGVTWDRWVEHTVQRGWAGLECLSGIPGLVGAAPIQNIGAYGQEVASCIESVSVWDRQGHRELTVAAADCGFAYRWSRFKANWAQRYIVTAVTFALQPHGQPRIVYPELRARVQAKAPTLQQVRQTVLEIRASKSMVLRPGDPNRRSAGSFFVNPVLSHSQLQDLCAKLQAHGIPTEALPRYPAPNGTKVPAAWLIEQAGFTKGYGHGPAGLSTRHTLALVNRGGATAAHLLTLAREIRRGVHHRFGVWLAAEPVLVGFTEPPWEAL